MSVDCGQVMRCKAFNRLRPTMRLFACLSFLTAPAVVRAHDPLDCSSRMAVTADSIQVTVTMGLDGVREILSAAGFSNKALTETIVSRGPNARREMPASLAARLFEVKSDDELLAATSVRASSDGMEVVFEIDYPRRPTGALAMRAAYFDEVPEMRPGWFVAVDENQVQVFAGLLSPSEDTARLQARPHSPSGEQASAETAPSSSVDAATSAPPKQAAASHGRSFAVLMLLVVAAALAGLSLALRTGNRQKATTS